jgi:hypothetical protein
MPVEYLPDLVAASTGRAAKRTGSVISREKYNSYKRTGITQKMYGAPVQEEFRDLSGGPRL